MKKCTCSSKGNNNQGEPRFTGTMKLNKVHVKVQNMTDAELQETARMLKRKAG
jgi:hypothetical protein